METIKLPVLVMRGLSLLPQNILKLDVGRDVSKNAINAALASEKKVFVTTQINPFIEEIDASNIYYAGVIADVVSMTTLPNGHLRVTLQGLTRARIARFDEFTPYIKSDVELTNSIVSDEKEEIALMRKLMTYVDVYINKLNFNTEEMMIKVNDAATADVISDLIAFYLPTSLERKQEYISTLDTNERLLMLITDLEMEKELSSIDSEIDAKLKDSMEKSQKEYYLREKIRVIKEELGDDAYNDNEALVEEIEKLGLPEKVYDKVMNELSRYNTMPASSQEASIIRTYLDWILALPWSVYTEDISDINAVEASLNASHFGLEKVKERIIDYLAVKQMTDSLDSPILCLVGPPGTGKTSLAVSIAAALGRNYVKMSLGGVRDESEIRGHRRTYLGAMPGRVIQGMKKAKSVNPLFLLDEIDKMSSDFRGDPASAMLEVLDPAQNSHFSDNYLEEEYDLSNVLFIATANYYDQIPQPLLDRMEIIHLSSYTEIEKLHIAKSHLYQTALNKHGLKPSQLKFKDDAYLKIIRAYTREAGVRQLEREISKVCRKIVRKVLTDELKSKTITANNLEDYLGKARYEYTHVLSSDQIGVVTGLAYTAFGGDILPLEVTYYTGTGKIKLTGSLGEVMQESAHIALSYIKANHKAFGIEFEMFDKIDIHIHAPEGAVPKDGPSAGVTLTTALISALTKRKVDRYIGMTGEITLHGNVLPIGGLREKAISAHRSGLHKILIPFENVKDIEDIPSEVVENLDIVPIKQYQEIYKVMFNG